MALAIGNYQPSLVVSETIAMTGIFPSRDFYNDGMTLGMFHTYGFLLGLAQTPTANGQLINIGGNTALFSLLGTTFGGDGQTTFALPDLGGRAAIADGQGQGLNQYVLGEQRGAATTLLTQSQMPASLGGTSAPIDEDDPGLAVKYLIRVEGIYPSQGGSGISLNFLGSIVKFGGNFVPRGYLECNGQLLDIATNDALFSLIGTTYGGDGQTNFALPDLRGRAMVGAGGNYVLGEFFGREDVLIGQAHLPVEMGGGGLPIDNREPSLAINYCIALNGLFPSANGGADPYTPFLGEIIAFAGGFAPSGFALCQGQLLPINQNQALFALLGTTYGGDGRVTFALPDFRDRAAVGSGNGFTAGERFGADFTTLTLDDIPDLAYAGSGADETHYGGNGADAIDGLGGNDTIIGHGGNDTLKGGAGNDTLDGRAGADNMIGGSQNDTYSVDNGGDSVIELINQGYDTVNTTLTSFVLPANVERLNSNGTGNFIGTGNTLDNRFQSLGGDDRFVDVAGGADIFSGGNGTDTVDFRTSATGAIINFATNVHGGAVLGDTYASIEKFLGSNVAKDTMTGGGIGRFVFVGGGGNDVLTGGVKNDQLLGQVGQDTLIGGADKDSLDGGTGNDTMAGGGGGDVFVYVDAAFGQDTITDYEDGLDSFKVFSAVADDASDFTITGNGTNSVILTLIAAPANTITLNGAAPITISNADFVFY